jgi:hypothetical protein
MQDRTGVVCQRYPEEGGIIREYPGAAEKRRENKALARTGGAAAAGGFDSKVGPELAGGGPRGQNGAILQGTFEKPRNAFEASSNP